MVHGAKYQYPSLDNQYVDAKTPITIICTKHGEFDASPDNHLTFQGGKCPQCGKNAKPNAAKSKYKAAYLDWINEALPDHLSLAGDFSNYWKA